MVEGAAGVIGDVASFFGFTRVGEEKQSMPVVDIGYSNPAACEGDTIVTHAQL